MTDQQDSQSGLNYPVALARRAVHRIGYWARRASMGLWGPAQQAEPVDPVENMKKEHEVQEAVDAAEIEAAEEQDAAPPPEAEIVADPAAPEEPPA